MRLVVLVGLPGSGKTTWAARQPYSVLSSDAVRLLIADDATIQTIHRRVFATLRSLARQRMDLHRPVTCIDSTALTRWERRPWIRLADNADCEAEAIFFDTPLEICLARNAHRDRVVPADVVREMARRLEPPSIREGFARVITLTPASPAPEGPAATAPPPPAESPA
jgi:predicted kinase